MTLNVKTCFRKWKMLKVRSPTSERISKLACDTYDELRLQALNVIFDEKNTNQIVLALRILHQNGGAMMMDDFKQQIQSRINCADGSSKDTKDSSAPVDPVQLVYTLLANRLVQFDRSNGTEVFSFLL